MDKRQELLELFLSLTESEKSLVVDFIKLNKYKEQESND